MNATAEVAPESLRVATYNIRQSGCDRGTPNAWVERKADVVALIRKLAPDVFGCQEVLPDQADYLRENLAEFAFAGEHRNKDRVSGEASPVLYRKDRFAALDGGTFWLSETPDVPGSMSWGAGYPRICSWVRLKDRQTGGVFCFASTHTDNKSELARKEGLLLVLRRMRESNPPGTPLVLVGDFNCRENEEPVEAVAEQMENALYASETPPAGPWRTTNGWQWNEEDPSVEETLSLDSETRNPKIKHGGRIDYIFVSKGVMVRSIETVGDPRPGLQTYPSDHFPVVAVLELPQSAVAADFPSYRQSFEATFATAEESAAAECAIAPLPGGAELAFGCRWDDSSPAHLAKAAMMGRAGVKGTFYVSANRTEFMGSGILGKLIEGGHAIGNHTFSHPQLFELNPNAGFREIAENRVALETAIQRPVVSYVSPYGWGKNPLDPQHRPALAESVVATGHFVTQDNPGSWGDGPPDAAELMPCWRFSANDSKPSRELFEKGFGEMLAKAREAPDIPRFGLGTHSWCDEHGNALQETLIKEHCLNPDWAQLNDWEYGAYRYEAVHGGVRKVSVSGNRATFEATRFLPAFLGDAIPLSLTFSGAEPITAKTAESDLAKGERGTWTLPHAKEAGRLHDRIERADADGLCPAFPGLRVMVEPDEETGRLNVCIENQTGRDLRCIHVAAAFPPKWTIRKARTAADALPDSGTWECAFEMGCVRRRDYVLGSAYYPVSVDFSDGGGLFRIWAEKTMPRVEVPKTAPARAARVWGPADATALDGADWAAASLPGAALPDAENWRAPESGGPDSLWCLVEKMRVVKGAANEHVRALANDPKQGRFVVYDFDAADAGPMRLRTNVPATRRNVALWVNGEGVPYSGPSLDIEARQGRNRVILRADMVVVGTKTDVLYLAVDTKNCQ